MNIRKAQASDLEAIAKLEAICFPKAEAADLACFKERFPCSEIAFGCWKMRGKSLALSTGCA